MNFETIDSNINAYPDMFLNQNGVTFTKKVLEDLGYPAFVLCLLDAKARGICNPFLQEQRTEGIQVLQAERRTERCCYDLQQESA